MQVLDQMPDPLGIELVILEVVPAEDIVIEQHVALFAAPIDAFDVQHVAQHLQRIADAAGRVHRQPRAEPPAVAGADKKIEGGAVGGRRSPAHARKCGQSEQAGSQPSCPGSVAPHFDWFDELDDEPPPRRRRKSDRPHLHRRPLRPHRTNARRLRRTSGPATAIATAVGPGMIAASPVIAPGTGGRAGRPAAGPDNFHHPAGNRRQRSAAGGRALGVALHQTDGVRRSGSRRADRRGMMLPRGDTTQPGATLK